MSDDNHDLEEAVEKVWTGEENTVVVSSGEYSFSELDTHAVRVQYLSSEESFVGQSDLVSASGVIVELIVDSQDKPVEERKAFDKHKLDAMESWIENQTRVNN